MSKLLAIDPEVICRLQELPKNETIYVDKKGENCECAHPAERGAVIPFVPALGGVATLTGIVIVVTGGGNPGSE